MATSLDQQIKLRELYRRAQLLRTAIQCMIELNYSVQELEVDLAATELEKQVLSTEYVSTLEIEQREKEGER